ncbi:molybdate transport system substrate-binding protein [Paenibacillus sp. UNCCL117]|nr:MULTISPECIES: molybdate ABC transporter substrate-binding protein [unclassified Paenibacillus]SDC15880.1 molybdate transport system substrate-binding protein [Paenibacillus sp. cl123]SFW17640.1 molybdate transport system substrate-binding protein [Paenibacillus sp. UNCCL117]
MRHHGIKLLLLAGLLLPAGCGKEGVKGGEQQAGSAPVPGKQVELLVSAAASLTDSLNELETAYTKLHPEVKLIFNYAASGTLQQQIEQGAPSDLFLSAGAKQMEALVEKKLVAATDRTNLLTNELVAVTAKDGQASIAGVQDLAGPVVKKLAVGQPESVPAGSYAKESLTFHKLWDRLQPKMVFAKDVRQVLSYVETGNVEAGYVYRTDALSSGKVRIAYTADPAGYKPVEYPIGIVKATARPKEARELYEYLQGPEAREIFIRHGFTVPKKS